MWQFCYLIACGVSIFHSLLQLHQFDIFWSLLTPPSHVCLCENALPGLGAVTTLPDYLYNFYIFINYELLYIMPLL